MIKYCFSGFLSSSTNLESSLWQRVQQEYREIQPSELRANSDSREEAARLNKLDSRHWLLTEIIELLAKGNPDFTSNIQIIESIFALKKQRSFLLGELEPLKKKYYPNLAKLQKITRLIQNKFSLETELERDYKIIENILEKLTRYIFVTGSSKSSNKELIKIFRREWELNQTQINTSSLVILYEIQRLLTWMSYPKTPPRSSPTKITSRFIGDISKNKYHFEDACEHWKALMYDFITKKTEERKNLKIFTDHDDPNLKAYNLTRCKDCNKMKQ